MALDPPCVVSVACQEGGECSHLPSYPPPSRAVPPLYYVATLCEFLRVVDTSISVL